MTGPLPAGRERGYPGDDTDSAPCIQVSVAADSSHLAAAGQWSAGNPPHQVSSGYFCAADISNGAVYQIQVSWLSAHMTSQMFTCCSAARHSAKISARRQG